MLPRIYGCHQEYDILCQAIGFQSWVVWAISPTKTKQTVPKGVARWRWWSVGYLWVDQFLATGFVASKYCLGKWSHLMIIFFEFGWNHQLGNGNPYLVHHQWSVLQWHVSFHQGNLERRCHWTQILLGRRHVWKCQANRRFCRYCFSKYLAIIMQRLL